MHLGVIEELNILSNNEMNTEISQINLKNFHTNLDNEV